MIAYSFVKAKKPRKAGKLSHMAGERVLFRKFNFIDEGKKRML